LSKNELSETIIGNIIELHNISGPGLLESVYERSLAYELRQSSLDAERQRVFLVTCKEQNFEESFYLDLLVNNKIIVE
jgi:GxxExxY protein